MELKQQLYQLYQDKCQVIDLDNTVSSPLLIHPEYANINTDIMFVGQETNSYYGSWEDFDQRGVSAQMGIYKQFMEVEYPSMGNLFFQYIRKLMKDTKGIPVWNNLFKFDLGDIANKKNISKAEADELKIIQSFHYGLLAEEIKIIQPKIIIFFTGHVYDKLFFDPLVVRDGDYKLLYQPIDVLKEQNIDEWKCCQLGLNHFEGFENFKGKAIRTYHPLYLNRTSYKETILSYLADEIKSVCKDEVKLALSQIEAGEARDFKPYFERKKEALERLC